MGFRTPTSRRQYDAFKDNPWPLLYRELDAKYPGSRFILTVRDSESWIRSQLKAFGSKETPMRKWTYGAGCPKGNEDIYIERLERHNREVREYFKDRPEDLLVMDVIGGEGWTELCTFLGAEIPAEPFPNVDAATGKQAGSALEKLFRKSRKLVRRAKNLARRVLR